MTHLSRWIRRVAAMAAAMLPSIVLPSAAVVSARAEEGDLAAEVVREFPQPMQAAATAAYRPIRLSADAERTEAILAAVATTEADLSFAEAPLADVVEAIAAKAKIDAGIDSRALEDAGIDSEAAVSGGARGRRLLDALRSMIDPLGLAVVVRHGRLLVTTHERSQDPSYLQTFLYPVLPGTDAAELRDLIEATVAPETWDTVGGSGAARQLPVHLGSGIVVSQTEENHERIASLLGGLDRAIWKGHGPGQAARFVRTHPVTDPAARDRLAGSLVEICNNALTEGHDPEALVEVVGESLVVRSRSRAFHVMAAAVITALEGVESFLIEAVEEDEPRPAVQATSAPRDG